MSLAKEGAVIRVPDGRDIVCNKVERRGPMAA